VTEAWGRQPLLHDKVICLAAPALAISGADGQIRGGPAADGFYVQDRRVLCRLVVRVDDREPEPISTQVLTTRQARFVAIHRSAEDPNQDPVIIVDRLLDAGGQETVTLRNTGAASRELRLTIELGCDLTPMFLVKQGRSGPLLAADMDRPAVQWTFAEDGTRVAVTTTGPEPFDRAEPHVLRWNARLEPRGTWSVVLRVHVDEPKPADHFLAPVSSEPPWTPPAAEVRDRRLARLLDRSLSDLEALRLADPLCRDDEFLAAGSPWFLTLFGRDSIWAARMMLSLGTDLAGGTLRTLARRQGTREDAASEEEPGRILHELRRGDAEHAEGLLLPACYYGSVDVTPLFVNLVVDAHRWGMPTDQVQALMPAASEAMEWVRKYGDIDGDGLIEYDRRLETGLVHQGWKDSADAIAFADGRRATHPIALCEVQGYAYEAAIGWAELLDKFSEPGAQDWRAWAAELRHRFRERFWVEDDVRRYVAIALDGTKRPVTGLASNMAHLLATGLLDPDERRQVADLLVGPELNSGWGLRTRGEDSARFNPLSYHGGSVWVHDTAIAIHGLAVSGFEEHARILIDGLLDAARCFDFQLPELFGGERRTAAASAPLPYPTACRPQAWAAAGAVAVLQATTML
jgi:glycogen debranching enzyme